MNSSIVVLKFILHLQKSGGERSKLLWAVLTDEIALDKSKIRKL
jgi:hypothetical protein